MNRVPYTPGGIDSHGVLCSHVQTVGEESGLQVEEPGVRVIRRVGLRHGHVEEEHTDAGDNVVQEEEHNQSVGERRPTVPQDEHEDGQEATPEGGDCYLTHLSKN